LSHPPNPGTKPFQTIPHPRARSAGLVPGVAQGGMVTGKIEPCISKHEQVEKRQNEISLYIITTPSNIQVVRIRKAVIKDKMS